MANLHIIESEVLGEKNGVYRLKVSVLDLGMYMFGFRASKSDKNTRGWWIQSPAIKTSSGWKNNPEFDKKQTLWLEIEESCTNTVISYGSTSDDVYIPEDSELTDEAIAKSLDESIEKQSKAIPWMDED